MASQQEIACETMNLLIMALDNGCYEIIIMVIDSESLYIQKPRRPPCPSASYAHGDLKTSLATYKQGGRKGGGSKGAAAPLLLGSVPMANH